MLVLPGVGDFGAVTRAIHSSGLWTPIQDYLAQGRPFLGICVGMQLLFGFSDEAPESIGFGVMEGKLKHLNSLNSLDVTPSVGWRKLNCDTSAPSNYSLGEAYFVHSYFASGVSPADLLSTYTWNGHKIPAHVARGKIHGVQFHPEKSRISGIDFIERVIESALDS